MLILQFLVYFFMVLFIITVLPVAGPILIGISMLAMLASIVTTASNKERLQAAKTASEAGWIPPAEKGYTLIELLLAIPLVMVVIVLLGSITVAMLPWMLGAVFIYFLFGWIFHSVMAPNLKYGEAAEKAGWLEDKPPAEEEWPPPEPEQAPAQGE